MNASSNANPGDGQSWALPAGTPRGGKPGTPRRAIIVVQLTSAVLALALSASAAPQSTGRLAGRTYVITGASSGFGRGGEVR